MKRLQEMYEENKRIKFYVDLILIFVLPQFLIGILSSGSMPAFSSYFTFEIYLFLRNLCLISIYIFIFVVLFNDIDYLPDCSQKLCKFLLCLYIIGSLLLTAFYSGTPYTVISYIVGRYQNIFIYPYVNDPFYQGINYVVTGDFFINQ